MKFFLSLPSLGCKTFNAMRSIEVETMYTYKNKNVTHPVRQTRIYFLILLNRILSLIEVLPKMI